MYCLVLFSIQAVTSDHRKILKWNVSIDPMRVSMVSRVEIQQEHQLLCFSLAVAYGQGCYFARDSLYSHSFAAPDRNGIHRMFLGKLYSHVVQSEEILII